MKHVDMLNRSHQNGEKTKSGLAKFVDRILKGSHQHYFQYFPSPSGFLTFIFLKRFFSGIVLESEQTRTIENLPEKKRFKNMNVRNPEGEGKYRK